MDDLIRRAVAAPDDDPLYVVAIGAITNMAAPCCSNRIWSARSWWYGWVGTRTTSRPDGIQPDAGSGCRPGHFRQRRAVHVQIRLGVASPSDTRSELDETIKGRNAISDFLYERFVSYSGDHFWAKEIWDISAIAYLLDEATC